MTSPELPVPAPHPTETAASVNDGGEALGLPSVGEVENAPTDRLHREQLQVVTDYVTKITDRQSSPEGYRNARARMDHVSEQVGGDGDLGRVGITAATLGAMSRDPRQRETAATLLRRMSEESGMPRDHLDILWKMHGTYSQRATPQGVGQTLKSGLDFLDARERTGDDVSKARVAFKVSAFAATQDQGLRTAIFNDLRRSVAPSA